MKTYQANKLPDLGLARNRGDCAGLSAQEGIEHRALADVGVANKADTNLFAVGVQRRELPQERDERTLAKGVCDGCAESAGRDSLLQSLDPACLFAVSCLYPVSRRC